MNSSPTVKTRPPAATAITETSQAGKTWSSRAGFTFLELIAVIVVAGLAAGLVSVSVSRYQDRTRFTGALRRVAVTIRSARTHAILERDTCEFSVFPPDETSFVEEQEVVRYGYVCEGGKQTSYALPPGMTLEGPSLMFFPRGYTTGGYLSLRSARGRTAGITVDSVTAKVSVEP